MTAVLDADRVRALNDILRRTLSGGTLVLTAGVVALGRERQQTILDAVAAFDRFEPDNDPHGEHDFGAVEAAGERVFWKIDCYDRTGRYASPEPDHLAPVRLGRSCPFEEKPASVENRRVGVIT